MRRADIGKGVGMTMAPWSTAVALLLGLQLVPVGGWQPTSATLAAQEVVGSVLTQVGTTLLAQEETFHDPTAKRLLGLARAARAREVEGLRSYEATLTERVQLGLGGRRFRRNRTLLEQDRVARVRWSRNEPNQVRWLGVRRQMVGVRLGEGEADPPQAGEREVSGQEGGHEGVPGFLRWAPGSDRLVFGGDWALNPLADTAHLHYRYRAGDSIRVTLPGLAEPVLLAELRVEPRRMHFQLVAASLWIHPESGQVARAAYRPGRPFSMRLDGDGASGDGIPRWFPDIQGEIRLVTVDYYLHDLQWWLPRSFRFQGEGRVGGAVRFPAAVEWELTGYEVNRGPMDLPSEDEVLPPGARLLVSRAKENEGEDEPAHPRRVLSVSYQASTDSLASHAGLPTGRVGVGGMMAMEEMGELEEQLRGWIPSPPSFSLNSLPEVEGGVLRHNRVEGLALAWGLDLTLPGEVRLEGLVRGGLSERTVRGELALVRVRLGGQWRLGGYRRLAGVSDWEDSFSLSASATSFMLGRDGATYLDVGGAELGVSGENRWYNWALRAFLEEHRSVDRSADFHLMRLFDADPFPENRPIFPVSLVGVGGELRGWWETPAQGLTLSARGWGEVGTADGEQYVRIAGSAAASADFPAGVGLGMEVGAGTLMHGDALIQRHFYLGGEETLRGFPREGLVGTDFWFGRVEVGRGLRVGRFLVFSDVAWAGTGEGLGLGSPWASVGAGVSVLEGLLRAEVARGIRGGSDTRVYLYLDGVL
ncbi:MAG: hypothetical protein WEA09_01675 [Gemmatimonadota bacterium]